MITVLLIALGYLIGSVSFAVVVSRLMGLPNPHTYGSGNPGATNVLRTGNKKAAVLTLLGDVAKGGLALGLAQWLGTSGLLAPYQIGEFTLAAVALAAFLGHLFPVYSGFQGGKGVATAAGILVVMNLTMAAVILGVWLAVAAVTRYSSLAAIIAAATAPFAAAFVFGKSWFTVAVLGMSLLLLWRHRGNMARLRAGTESRIRLGKRRDDAASADRSQ